MNNSISSNKDSLPWRSQGESHTVLVSVPPLPSASSCLRDRLLLDPEILQQVQVKPRCLPSLPMLASFFDDAHVTSIASLRDFLGLYQKKSLSSIPSPPLPTATTHHHHHDELNSRRHKGNNGVRHLACGGCLGCLFKTICYVSL